VDAPHLLPLWHKTPPQQEGGQPLQPAPQYDAQQEQQHDEPQQEEDGSQTTMEMNMPISSGQQSSCPAKSTPTMSQAAEEAAKRSWDAKNLVAALPDHEQQQPWAKEPEPAAIFHGSAHGSTASICHAAPLSMPLPVPKRAWLVSPLLLGLQADLQRLFLSTPSVCRDQAESRQLSLQAVPIDAAGTGAIQAATPAAVGAAEGAPAATHSSIVQPQHPVKHQASGAGSSTSASLDERPALPAGIQAGAAAAAPSLAPVVLDDQQFLGQTCGWDMSLGVLQKTIREQGPFDGLLGFSQGASVAAVIVALQQMQQGKGGGMLQQQELGREAHTGPCVKQEKQHRVTSMKTAAPRCASNANMEEAQLVNEHPSSFGKEPFGESCDLRFRFVVLCSGFVSPCAEHRQLLQVLAPLQIPSLHVFGSSDGGDRQISHALSQQLATFFDDDCKQVLVHPSGHVIPCSKEVTSRIASFLDRFVASGQKLQSLP
jgi:hypothetical protein